MQRAYRSASLSQSPSWCTNRATAWQRASSRCASTCCAVPVVRTPYGLRAVNKGKPGDPVRIETYLAGKFGDRLDGATRAMTGLAAAHEPADLYRRGFGLYEQFR